VPPVPMAWVAWSGPDPFSSILASTASTEGGLPLDEYRLAWCLTAQGVWWLRPNRLLEANCSERW